MKERRDGEREGRCPPSVPWRGCSQLLICRNFSRWDGSKQYGRHYSTCKDGALLLLFTPVHVCSDLLQRGEAGWRNLRHTSRGSFVPQSPPTDLSNHLQSVLYFKGGFFKHRDICIEMFYSELLLIECSEAEPGEGTGKLLQRHKGDGSRVWH